MSPAAAAPGLRVLIAEDDPASLKVLALAMESIGAEITCVTDGRQAVDASESHDFDVVLMDLRMPEMDGFEAIRRMRLREGGLKRRRTPVVVVSAHTRPAEIQQAQAAGADHHLGKPIDVPRLLGTIDSLMDARRQP